MSTFTVKELEKKKESELEEADAILLQAIVKYKELMALARFQEAEIAKAIEAPRKIIESYALNAPDYKIIAPTFKVSFTENKSLNTEAVIEAFGRVKLAPFITETINRTALEKAFGEKKIEPFLKGTGVRQLRVS